MGLLSVEGQCSPKKEQKLKINNDDREKTKIRIIDNIIMIKNDFLMTGYLKNQA